MRKRKKLDRITESTVQKALEMKLQTGLTMVQIAKRLNVNYDSLRSYIHRYTHQEQKPDKPKRKPKPANLENSAFYRESLIMPPEEFIAKYKDHEDLEIIVSCFKAYCGAIESYTNAVKRFWEGKLLQQDYQTNKKLLPKIIDTESNNEA